MTGHRPGSTAGSDGLTWHLVPLPADRTDDDILDDLHDFHPERYHADGREPWVRDPPWLPPGARHRDDQDEPGGSG